uniref:Uncharacterized protein n=1 Tax=Sphaerodactylus townsendi TaxID=933632 RepID=A0ACB8G8T3_9SAUR
MLSKWVIEAICKAAVFHHHVCPFHKEPAWSAAFTMHVDIRDICQVATWSDPSTLIWHYTISDDPRGDAAVGGVMLQSLFQAMLANAATMRILIKGGKVVNDDCTLEADVYIENGIIQQVGRELMIPGGAKVIDATGKLVIPGGIDTSTHFHQTFMNATCVDDFYHGTKCISALKLALFTQPSSDSSNIFIDSTQDNGGSQNFVLRVAMQHQAKEKL